MRSTFEVVEERPGQVTFNIEGPFLESLDDAPTLADCHIGLETVLDSHNVLMDLGQLAELRDSIDFDSILGRLSGGSQLLGKIEDELIAAKVITQPKRFQ